jgi:hypothetical protein
MSILSRLLGRSKSTEARADSIFRIPTVPPPLGRPISPPPSCKNLNGLNDAERKQAVETYHKAMRNHFREIAAFNRERCVGLDIPTYKWVAIPNTQPCDVAKRNDGKTFSYLVPPPDGHPREGKCNSADWCRCIAKPIIKGFT